MGPKVTQTSVNLSAVDLSLLSGSATIKDMVVGNPQGYSTPQAFSVGTIAVSLPRFQLFQIKFGVFNPRESPQITYEGSLVPVI